MSMNSFLNIGMLNEYLPNPDFVFELTNHIEDQL